MAASIDHVNAARWRAWRILGWGTAAFLLALPAVAMLFTREVQWEAHDFLIMGAILFLASGTFDLATRVAPNFAYIAAAAVALGSAFLLIWINLAVGIIGSERNPANLMFAGVLAVAIVGTVFAGARPRRLARALYVTAIAQASVAVVVAMNGPRDEALVLSTFFVLPWVVSAALFGHAAHEQARDGVAA